MADLPEQHSPKAARILIAAGELLLSRGSRGFTVADVAQKAHVGKGTVYLYWATKEDLLLGLIARDYLAVAAGSIEALTADPHVALPSHFCPRLLRTSAQRPFVKALQNGDDGLLGLLADDPRSKVLVDALGPGAVMNTVLPSWRRNGLARTDWTLEDQAFALHVLVKGFPVALAEPLEKLAPADPYEVMSAAVTALLGPEQATLTQIHDAAGAIVAFLEQGRTVALRTIGLPTKTSS